MLSQPLHSLLSRGVVIPAHPLALTAGRKLDERRQRALSRYYIAAGSGGLALGVHMTQFSIRDPRHDLFRPVLELTREEMDRADANRPEPLLRIAGICGPTSQAVAEAELIHELGYHAGLLNLAALSEADDQELLDHCREVARVTPVFGFYLQSTIGGRELSYGFWRRFVELPEVVAIKLAPFNRYHTLEVLRAVAEAGREDIALYTGNDDNIVMDLITPHRFRIRGKEVELRIVGGLLGALGRVDPAGGRDPGGVPRLPQRRRDIAGIRAEAGHRGDRQQRGLFRCRQRFSGLRPGVARSAASPGAAGGHLVPGSGRNPGTGATGGDRPRLPGLSPSQRRRLCAGAPGRMAPIGSGVLPDRDSTEERGSLHGIRQVVAA